MRIGEPARKHGIADEDIAHAVAHVVVFIATNDEGFTMLAGPARNGALLEIGVLDIDGDDPVVIHADNLRRSFYQYL
jgi:hypothetical protein